MIIWLKLSISIDFWTQLLLKAHRHFWTQLLIRWLKTGSPKYQWPWSWSVRISEIPRVIASCHGLLEFKWSQVLQVCLGSLWSISIGQQNQIVLLSWPTASHWLLVICDPMTSATISHTGSRMFAILWPELHDWLHVICGPVTLVTIFAPSYLWPRDLSHITGSCYLYPCHLSNITGSMLSVPQWPETHYWLHVICAPVTWVTLLAPCYLWPSDLSLALLE